MIITNPQKFFHLRSFKEEAVDVLNLKWAEEDLFSQNLRTSPLRPLRPLLTSLLHRSVPINIIVLIQFQHGINIFIIIIGD